METPDVPSRKLGEAWSTSTFQSLSLPVTCFAHQAWERWQCCPQYVLLKTYSGWSQACALPIPLGCEFSCLVLGFTSSKMPLAPQEDRKPTNSEV